MGELDVIPAFPQPRRGAKCLLTHRSQAAIVSICVIAPDPPGLWYIGGPREADTLHQDLVCCMNCEVFTLSPTSGPFELEQHQVREVLRILLHTIVFQRALGPVKPVERDSELFEITWVSQGCWVLALQIRLKSRRRRRRRRRCHHRPARPSSPQVECGDPEVSRKVEERIAALHQSWVLRSGGGGSGAAGGQVRLSFYEKRQRQTWFR